MFPQAFIDMLGQVAGPDGARAVLEALEQPPSVSLRLNPAKLRDCPFSGAVPVPWSPFGWILPKRPVFTLDPLLHAGCYYVQDSSAMFPAELFRRTCLPEAGAVLDLCAAPGGKSTDLAASLRQVRGEDFTLVANEVNRSRFKLLKTNMEVWGDANVSLLCKESGDFPKYPLFDAIVADVPCSGEGMFRKDKAAVGEWSPRAVAFCAARQKHIISEIWPSLREGGTLIYSTCTFNRIENDGNVDWIAAELGAEVLDAGDFPGVARTPSGGYALFPGFVPGEGQYAAALRKKTPHETARDGNQSRRSVPHASLPSQLGAMPVPGSADLPAKEGGGTFFEVDRQTALRYLHGDALNLPGAPVGRITLTYLGHPLGPAKNIGSRCNNLYPKDRRIRMDVG